MNKKLNLLLSTILFSSTVIFPAEQILGKGEVLAKETQTHQHHQDIANQDLEYMTNLALIKGHLIVGKELLLLKEYEQVKPHFAHPVDEIYDSLAPLLKKYNVADFKQELIKLNDLVKYTPSSSQVMAAYDLTVQKLDEAIAAVPSEQLNSSSFILGVINNLLATTEEEYTAAIIDNKVVENVEYQDSRGFVLYSEMLYQKIANNKNSSSKTQALLAEIKSAFPEPIPPQSIVKTPEEMTKLVEEFKKYASN